MTTLAIVFMLLAMLIIWGGLTVAIVFLVKHPLEDDDGDVTTPPGPTSRSSR